MNDPELRNWEFATNSSGWPSNEIALHWLSEAFMPSTKPRRASQWRYLVTNGYNSHINEPFLLSASSRKSG